LKGLGIGEVQQGFIATLTNDCDADNPPAMQALGDKTLYQEFTIA
jgi:hypothetical protein